MKVFNYKDVESRKAEEGAENLTIRWLITKEIGAENFAMRLFEMKGGGSSPRHSHPWEHEVFILEGKGSVYGGGQGRKFKKGDVVFIPANEEHQFKNSGKKTVKFICLIPYVKKK
jgi:quercetin dioxygenase-like cupin family protein